MAAFDVVYVSPHADDAVFSCGGAIALDVRAGRRTAVATVFSDTPDPSATEARRREDRVAIEGLGAIALDLGLPDAERRDPTRRRGRLFAPPGAEEAGRLVEQLREALAGSVAGARVIAPLAVGQHVDHQLVHAACAGLCGLAGPIHYYEDMPYALCPPLLRRRLASLGAVPRAGVLAALSAWLRIAAWWARRPALVGAAPALLLPFAAAALGLRLWPPGRRDRPPAPAGWAEERLDVSAVLDEKLAAIVAYPSQWRHFYHQLSDLRAALLVGSGGAAGGPFERRWRRL